jgi:hypothetical protein
MEKRTYKQRLNRYEEAQEAICMLMAMRTDWIHKEESKAHPDPARIGQWTGERTRFHEEMDALRFDDDAAIDHVFRDYAPLLKADPERARAALAVAA